MAAITYAKAKGNTVVATTRQPAHVDRLKQLGADHVIIDDGSIQDNIKALYPQGVDKAIELVGANTVIDTMQSLRRWGEVAFVGFLGGKPVKEQFHFMNDLPNTVKLSFFGSGLLGSSELPVSDSPLNWIAEQVRAGSIPSIHAKTFSIEQIREAHELLESNKALGKIVVTY
jgi:NADPH:quinone reductase-like Zn-dependent oxidoreductase